MVSCAYASYPPSPTPLSPSLFPSSSSSNSSPTPKPTPFAPFTSASNSEKSQQHTPLLSSSASTPAMGSGRRFGRMVMGGNTSYGLLKHYVNLTLLIGIVALVFLTTNGAAGAQARAKKMLEEPISGQ